MAGQTQRYGFSHEPMRGESLSDTTTVQIIPANDWFFIHAGDKKPTVHVIAAWALRADGATVGLIGGVPTGPGSIMNDPVRKLVGVPPVLGTYKHLRDLTKAEREALDSTS